MHVKIKVLGFWFYILVFFTFLYLAVCLFFYFYQESFLFHPRKTSDGFVYNFDYPYEETFYNTPNNGRIHTLTFKAENAKGVVYYLHGNAGSLRDWGWIYPNFIKHGYDLVLIDYRTYGQSTGKLTEKNMHSDVAFVYNELKKEYAENNIVIYGRSIGTGMATRLAATVQAKALVLESPYYSLKNVAQKIAPIFPLNLLLKFKFESYKYITQVNYPIYIIHGTNDNVVPFASGYKLYETAKDKIVFYEVQGGQHNDLVQFPQFEEMLTKVLN